jgi:hypothetical protein
MGFKLESLHLYRKVPRDLTDATSMGGAISLACAVVMAYLFVSNINDYLKLQSATDVALDDTGEVHMRIFFNITMERLPCQFAVVDVEDIMGTSVTNVSKEILKFKVAPDSGHRQEFYIDEQPSIVHEELEPEELEMHMGQPSELPRLTDDDFERVVKQGDISLVAFGAPWCPWSQRLEPVWRKTYAEMMEKPYAANVRMGRVDCTASDSQSLCHKHHIHAFPTIRIYRHKQLHSHENYLGDRDSAAFIAFMEESLPKSAKGGHRRELPPGGASSKTEGHDMQGEGCQLTGSLQISRVPGNFRVSAFSESHSFNTRVMNVSHHVDKLVFGAINEAGRLKHVMPIEERSGLFSTSFMMHQELATLKHYLKVVPYQYTFLDGETHHTYLYKANYNEYRPRKLEWFEGKADAHVDTALVPNAVFHYDISPVMVVVREETQAFASFVTKICAVIGGIYTVIGLIDNVIYHGGQSIKKAL